MAHESRASAKKASGVQRFGRELLGRGPLTEVELVCLEGRRSLLGHRVGGMFSQEKHGNLPKPLVHSQSQLSLDLEADGLSRFASKMRLKPDVDLSQAQQASFVPSSRCKDARSSA